MSDPAFRVAVSVPATTANLGPGYDCLGAALEWRDTYSATVLPDTAGITVRVLGEGAGLLPTDEGNLVARAVLEFYAAADLVLPEGLQVTCRNTIPHGRGLGSSSAAIVGGLALGRAFARAGGAAAGRDFSDDRLLALAARIEGHPDNVAPAVLGGFTPTWTEDGTGRAVRLTPDPSITPVLAVPHTPLSTSEARGLLPAEVPLEDAVFNASRAALLCHALTAAPELLLVATQDRLHQDRRAPMYPTSHDLVRSLRFDGLPAVISGAGPTVLVFATGDPSPVVDRVASAVGADWVVRATPFAMAGVQELDRAGLAALVD